jgi:ABC-type antimicrobial peptide transport system permease subunit
LNLYQPQQPRLLGVPESLIHRGGFAFTSLWEPTPEEREHPWRLLQRQRGAEVPVLADEHTATWVLHLSPGDVWNITDEHGQTVSLRLVGLLKGSIFQSELLLSESNFRRLFPSRGGYGFFLIDAPLAQVPGVKQTLEAAFGERFGFTVNRTLDRLAAFHAVENTYLMTFQVLGGLGLLLGTLGLVVVLLRNVWERQGELALLRALGYSRAALGWLVLAENGFLVLLGLAVGTIAALVAVVPHLVERATEAPWLGVAGLLALMLVVGLAAGSLAAASILRTPLLPALRRE